MKKNNIPACEFNLVSNNRTWTFSKPRDPDKLLDLVSEKQFELDRFLPYWAECWPAAEALFGFLERNDFQRHMRVLELGCGLGIISSFLSGIVDTAVACDISVDACEFSQNNILRHNGRALVVCADWRKPPFSRQFDIVIAADVLYEYQCILPVVNALETLVLPSGEVFIADPVRAHWSEFKKRITEKGFEILNCSRIRLNEGKTEVEILRLKRVGR
jgi:predicted nicotinamide N-methyase